MADEIERFTAADTEELRAEGRRLTGVVLAYADVSQSHRETFEAGAFTFADTVPLDLHHDAERAVAWSPGGGLTIESDDTSMRMVAVLPNIPAADRALAEVRSGKTTGLSVRFRPKKVRIENGLRVIEEALLTGIALVMHPSYTGSRVEARSARRRIWL